MASFRWGTTGYLTNDVWMTKNLPVYEQLLKVLVALFEMSDPD